MIFWAAEGGPDPKIDEILDLGSEISYEGGGGFLQRGGIFARLSTDGTKLERLGQIIPAGANCPRLEQIDPTILLTFCGFATVSSS